MTDSVLSVTVLENVDWNERGESGGVGGRDPKRTLAAGGRYVIPIALCNPVMSLCWERKVTVTSPGGPPVT